MKERFGGMWSYGSGPVAARVERLSAVKTKCDRECLRDEGKENQTTIENCNFVCSIYIERAPVQGESGRVVVKRGVGGRVVL